MLEKVFDYMGFFGPIILFVLTILLLKNKSTLLTFYVIGFVFNSILNIILKLLVQQPRPTEDVHLFNAAKNQKRVWFDKYGMPSGHAESAFYSVSFIFFALHTPWITCMYLLIALNTCYERVKYKNHTLLQVICGSIVGVIVGYLFYYSSSKKLMGLLKYKKDDNAPY